MFDPQLYRTKQEVEQWKKRDPIVRLAEGMRKAGMIPEDEIVAIEEDVKKEVADAVRFAEEAAWEPVAELTRFVYAEPKP